MLDKEAGEARLKTYPHPERTYYFKVNIADLEQVQSACAEALKVIPKGSLAGGVHCAAVATSRKWTSKLVDSVAVSAAPRLLARSPADRSGLQEDDGDQLYRNVHC